MENRYARQIIMRGVGEEGQKKLSDAKVLVVGSGGLGSPVLYYLVAAGIGTIGIVDFDVVSITNLNRQLLHFEKDVDVPKVESAYEKLHAFNSDVNLVKHDILLTEDNLDEILTQYDIVVDCVDNISTRHLVNKHALALDKYIVEGGIEGLNGFVMSVKKGSACYGCLNPKKAPEKKRTIPVLGATAGVIGSMQAAECLKIILGIGKPLFSKAMFIDLATMETFTININQNPNCPDCANAD